MSDIISANLNRINKLEIINLGFLVNSAAQWNSDKIYHLFDMDPRYNVTVYINNVQNSGFKYNLELTLSYFRKNGYNVVDLNDLKHANESPIPDILFHQLPYSTSKFGLTAMPLTVLNIYIPYSIATDIAEINRYQTPGYANAWKVFLSTKFDLEYYQKYVSLYSSNGIYLGYPKMDTLFIKNSNHVDSNSLWKINHQSDKYIVKIIYAPHHSIGKDTIQFSTFDKNYMFMYDYAKKHQNDTSWIIRPHPLLKSQAIKDGVFKDEREFDSYMNMWDKLPNAKVVNDGEYMDIFNTSDGMITDCVSFLSEYQYTGKPLLFLTRAEQKFIPYGDELVKVLYRTPGSETDGIVKFIDNVLIHGNDSMKESRLIFFKKYLDYSNEHGEYLASLSIYNHIISYFDGVNTC